MSFWSFGSREPLYTEKVCPICGGVVLHFPAGPGLEAQRAHLRPCKKESEETRIRELLLEKLEAEKKRGFQP